MEENKKTVMNDGYQPKNQYGYQPNDLQKGHQPGPIASIGNKPPVGSSNVERPQNDKK